LVVDEFANGSADENSDDFEFMMKYGREYLAFDLGYRIAQHYETTINGRQVDDAENAFAPLFIPCRCPRR
jgi:hypothetical protein